MANDKGMRVYQLAKTLNVESKQLLDYCGEDSPFDEDDRDALEAFAQDQLYKQRRRLLSVATATHSTTPPGPPRPVRT